MVSGYGPSVATWEVWRQDDNGNRFRMNTSGDRIEALAQVLALQCGPVHKQIYWVEGPAGPVCRTNRDLYRRCGGRRTHERHRAQFGGVPARVVAG